MARKRFRIVSYKEGDSTFFDTRIKTWFGWISFTVLYGSYIMHVVNDPLSHKSQAYQRIYQYCSATGYDTKNVVIYETNESDISGWLNERRGNGTYMPVF